MPTKNTPVKKTKSSAHSSKDIQESSQKTPVIPLPQAEQNQSNHTITQNITPHENKICKRKSPEPERTIDTQSIPINMPELEEFTEEDLSDLFETKNFFIRKVYSIYSPQLKDITDIFSPYGEINYKNSFVKETKDESIIYIAFETEQDFNNSKSFTPTNYLRIDPNDKYTKRKEINIYYRIVVMIPYNPFPSIEQIRSAFPSPDQTEKISIKESKLLAVIYLKSKDIFIKYLSGNPIALESGLIRPIPSLAASNNPNLTRILLIDLSKPIT